MRHDTVASVARFMVYDAKQLPCSAGAGSDGALGLTRHLASQRQLIAVLLGSAAATRSLIVCPRPTDQKTNTHYSSSILEPRWIVA